MRLPVPVIVVGNLIAGGAGKTPTVLAVAALMQRQGRHPGIVSRGYGRRSNGTFAVEPNSPADVCGDEPLLLRRRTGLPVFVGRDRTEAARALLRQHPEIDVIVADDGLQHTRLHRDVQVVVFDERGIGNGWLLPSGPLREAMPLAPPPGTVVLYNAPQPTTLWPGSIVRRKLAGAATLRAWWLGESPSLEVLEELRHRRLVAACGIARPERFFQMLRDAGIDFEPLPLPDHFDFAALPWRPETPDVVVTEKDAVKLDPDGTGATRIWVAALDFMLPVAFEAELLGLLGPLGAQSAAVTTPYGNTTA